MKEVFKPVVGYEGLYEVSNLGRVKSLPRKGRLSERILKEHLNGHGYCHVNLSKEGKTKVNRVHQLVAIAFLGHKPDGTQKVVTDHINGVKTDNRLDNLQLISQRENASKGKTNGTSKYRGVYWRKKNNRWVSKIYINGKNKHLGHFTCELEASEAYQKALKEIQCS